MKKLILLFFVLASLFLKANSQEEKYIALYIYNFTKYINWPSEAKSGDFVINIIGHESVYHALVNLTEGKTVGNQPIRVNFYKNEELAKEGHIQFLGHWQSRSLNSLLSKTSSKSSLILTEMAGLIDKGSAINFMVVDGSIKYEIKKKHAEDRGLIVNSRLESMAYKVHR
ncbi:MAG: YfiR family protein [bacterium]